MCDVVNTFYVIRFSKIDPFENIKSHYAECGYDTVVSGGKQNGLILNTQT